MRHFLRTILVLSMLAISACTTYIDEDYSQYLANNQGGVTYVAVGERAKYYIDGATKAHSLQVRSFTTDIANSWIVRFGKMLETTLRHGDVRLAFDSLSKTTTPDDGDGLVIAFKLINYAFEGFEAHVSVNVTVHENGRQILARTYQATGKSQGGKMHWAGAFGMKNAVQQSTKSAIDTILTNLVTDLKSALDASA